MLESSRQRKESRAEGEEGCREQTESVRQQGQQRPETAETGDSTDLVFNTGSRDRLNHLQSISVPHQLLFWTTELVCSALKLQSHVRQFPVYGPTACQHHIRLIRGKEDRTDEDRTETQ